MLTGSARQAQEALERAEKLGARQEVERLETVLARKRHAMESQIAALRAEFASDEVAAKLHIDQSEGVRDVLSQDREDMAGSRGRDAPEAVEPAGSGKRRGKSR